MNTNQNSNLFNQPPSPQIVVALITSRLASHAMRLSQQLAPKQPKNGYIHSCSDKVNTDHPQTFDCIQNSHWELLESQDLDQDDISLYTKSFSADAQVNRFNSKHLDQITMSSQTSLSHATKHVRAILEGLTEEDLQKIRKKSQLLEVEQSREDQDKRLEESETIFALIQEYCKLMKNRDATADEEARLNAIFALAEYDDELSALLDEATDLINYDLGIERGTSNYFPTSNSATRF